MFIPSRTRGAVRFVGLWIYSPSNVAQLPNAHLNVPGYAKCKVGPKHIPTLISFLLIKFELNNTMTIIGPRLKHAWRHLDPCDDILT